MSGKVVALGAAYDAEHDRSRARLALRDAAARRAEAKLLRTEGKEETAAQMERWALDLSHAAARDIYSLRSRTLSLGAELEQLITEHEGAL